jgi:hypothetical protein
LAHVDAWSKVFFRLGIGGCYMDNDLEAKRIRNFLPKFFDFKQRIRDKTKLLIAIDSHWRGDYIILLNNGKALELEESLLAKPNFDLILKKGKPIDASKITL